VHGDAPTRVVHGRESPTNIGMSLLSNLAAWDFGYITSAQLAQRCHGTVDTLNRMERYHGHWLNWYDTLTLEPLLPRYVSAVDSGNLAGHLLTLAAGLERVPDEPLIDPRVFQGIATTLDIVAELAREAPESVNRAVAVMEAELNHGAQAAGGHTLPGLAERLALLCSHAGSIADAAAGGSHELSDWSARLQAQCSSFYDELVSLAPWAARADQFLLDSRLTRVPTLRELAELALPEDASENTGNGPAVLNRLLAEGRARAAERVAQLDALAQSARAMAHMDFAFLYNRSTKLLAIGYNVTDHRMDASAYDLLASEIRLGSFVAIALGQLPEEHWFAMGRQLRRSGNEQVLVSWSGSMFEYLMPLLVMPSYPGTLLDQTYRAVVRIQADYGRQHEVPWGISESGYTTVDAAMNYQYHAFGVPGLGLKRGLGDDLVIAPYASMMSLMVDPELSAANLRRMAQLGFMGRHGFYEAIDYTLPRLPRGHDYAVVRSFMAHHQGMGFLALDYVLCGQPMQRRFELDPQLRATLLVLQERVPKAGAFAAALAPPSAVAMPAHEQPPPMRVVPRTVTPVPEVHLLSNGRYHVMISSAGAGYSRWKGSAVTRWREDGTRDHWGSFCYVRDADSGAVWSTTYQPTLAEPQGYEAVFAASRAEFRRHDRGIDLYTEVVVSPEDDIEMRRTRVTNNSATRRTLELTSYAEVAIAPQAADSSHPAFSKLFVQTELLPDERAILCVRRPRRLDEPVPCMLHLVSVHDTEARQVSFETSRPAFLGRGNDASMPAAMRSSGPLSGTSGAVLDPIVAIRCRIELEPGDSATLDYVTGMVDTRESARHLIDKYQDRTLADRVFELAWTHSQVVLRQLNATEAWAQLYARLAAAVIYPQAGMRADPSALVRNQRGQSGLWAYAISGDLPIVLLLLRDHNSVDLARQMVQAHAYWRLKGLQLDLVIWYQDTGYRQTLRDQIIGMITSGIDAQAIDRPGGIFVRAWDQVSPEDQVLMLSVARVVIDDAHGALPEQVARAARAVPKFTPLAPGPDVYIDYEDVAAALPELRMFNGLGGFTPDGREYVIRTSAGERTPVPWSNVLANPSFGSIVSESGQAYTWSENAHEFRLTPWHNDPVSDSSGEAFYIRDEQSGRFWSPSALPATGSGDYLTRHGFGYSMFEHTQDAIHSEMTTFVALDAALKYTVIRLRNDSDSLRRLSVTGYVEWVLGDMRDKTAMHVVTEVDNSSGALFARNAYNQEFGGRVAFFHVNAQIRTVTGDRSEFVGRTRTLADPAAMRRRRLSGRTGPALDPCGAFCAPFALHPGEERELVFVLGVGGRRTADAAHVIETCGGSDAAARALAKVREHWEQVLGAVQVRTPDPALDLMANGWLMYQTIACRMWARSGYYQSSGAFGYRDQLQDAMAVVHTRPQLLRDQLLLCAAHQFLQGDVQHWWHPPSGRGVRTHCSDDYLWLPLAAARYVATTGDYAVLSEPAPYLEGRPLNPDEESYYDMPGRAHVQGTLYEHCVRAIRHGLRVGEHGLPLIGTCDWNDGMDRVGHEGKGESVWLAWFLIAVLERFAPVATHQGDSNFAQLCRDHSAQLAKSIEANAWDGGWYRRAYFDDGTPLGSASNDECRIDSISQSWSVLSGAGDPERARAAMEQVDRQLVRRDARLVQLLDPPFDKTSMDPGYIRGYLPGVRENGGQYTHAAIWTAMAFAELGDVERAWELQRMLNPAIHASTPEGVEVYKVEPYAVAADVYGVPPHIGRGGWTWYTGSAGWMYRLIVESLLGLRLEITGEGARLHLTPCLPASWTGYRVDYRFRETPYALQIEVGDRAEVVLDGHTHPGHSVPLVDDGKPHEARITLSSSAPVRLSSPESAAAK
jgi:cellobiose phosphorylase